MRPSKNKTFMEMAITTSKRSHDQETKVGSVLVSNKTQDVLGTGYNGFIRGANDSILPKTRPDKYQYIVHSEQNLICNLARRGVSTEDTTLYCTMSPCSNCARLLFQAGVTKIVCLEKYKDFDSLKKMMDLEIVESISDEGYFELSYRLK